MKTYSRVYFNSIDDIDLPTEYGKSCDSKYNKQG